MFRFGATPWCSSSRNALDRAGCPVDAFDLFIPHQANLRIIDAGPRAPGGFPAIER
jgi:3-oxoacyl-[acyl-carrier-protein] synthase III